MKLKKTDENKKKHLFYSNLSIESSAYNRLNDTPVIIVLKIILLGFDH
jgi:hypothetical protein